MQIYKNQIKSGCLCCHYVFFKHVVKLPFCDVLDYYTQPQVYAMAKKMPYRSGHMNQMISCAALF